MAVMLREAVARDAETGIGGGPSVSFFHYRIALRRSIRQGGGAEREGLSAALDRHGIPVKFR